LKYEETYYGHKIIITTTQQASGRWTSKAELSDRGKSKIVMDDLESYKSEEEAKRGALSKAAGAIDQSRISIGKP
jgi:hypothetical protein